MADEEPQPVQTGVGWAIGVAAMVVALILLAAGWGGRWGGWDGSRRLVNVAPPPNDSTNTPAAKTGTTGVPSR